MLLLQSQTLPQALFGYCDLHCKQQHYNESGAVWNTFLSRKIYFKIIFAEWDTFCPGLIVQRAVITLAVNVLPYNLTPYFFFRTSICYTKNDRLVLNRFIQVCRCDKSLASPIQVEAMITKFWPEIVETPCARSLLFSGAIDLELQDKISVKTWNECLVCPI